MLAAGSLRKDPSVQCLACPAMPQKPNSSSQAFPHGHFDLNWGLFCSPELEFSGTCLLPALPTVQGVNGLICCRGLPFRTWRGAHTQRNLGFAF